jgi:hypothetical protein
MIEAAAPAREMELVTMQVVDWEGPIVEILFRRPLATRADLDELLRETSSFMEEVVIPAGRPQAYFLTCYDRFSVPRELARALQEVFLDFNRRYSKGDVRYGGTLVAKTLVISTAIRSESASELHATREEALAALRSSHRAAR